MVKVRTAAARLVAVITCASGALLGSAAPAVAVAVAGGIVDPGQGLAPPGAAKLTTLVSYVAWGVFSLCVVGVLITAAQMAVAHQRGGSAGEHGARLGWVLVACVVAGSASAFVAAMA